MKNFPKVGVAVIVRNGDKVLFGVRKGSHGAGTWAFPGGHLEFGESWENCALRELDEEIGVEVDNLRFLGATNDIFDDNKHYVTIFMMCDYLSGDLVNKEPEKCEGWKWMSADQLPDNLIPTIVNLMKSGYKLFEVHGQVR
jgi:8-oxo-dGTP diphosphatase